MHPKLRHWLGGARGWRGSLACRFVCERAALDEAACSLRRPELANQEALQRVDHGFEFEFAKPLPAEIELRIAVRLLETGALIQPGEIVLPAISAGNALKPILVTAPGRSGTTFLMGKLAQSDGIVVAESHPYEVRLMAYYATALHVLSSPADFERSMHPDRLEGKRLPSRIPTHFRVASMSPGSRRAAFPKSCFSEYAKSETIEAFRNTINEYYLRLRLDQGKNTAVYFAEKANNLQDRSRNFPRHAFRDVREVVLVRDPRDLLCSQRQYFKLDEKSGAQPAIRSVAGLSRVIKEQRSDTLVLKYEDLTTDYAKTSIKLFEFLGLEVPAVKINGDEGALFKAHATSDSVEASIGRWRTDLDADTIAFINRSCGEFLEQFGYPLN